MESWSLHVSRLQIREGTSIGTGMEELVKERKGNIAQALGARAGAVLTTHVSPVV